MIAQLGASTLDLCCVVPFKWLNDGWHQCHFSKATVFTRTKNQTFTHTLVLPDVCCCSGSCGTFFPGCGFAANTSLQKEDVVLQCQGQLWVGSPPKPKTKTLSQIKLWHFPKHYKCEILGLGPRELLECLSVCLLVCDRPFRCCLSQTLNSRSSASTPWMLYAWNHSAWLNLCF